MMKSQHVGLVAVGIGVVLAGCNRHDGRQELKGTVTVDGQPLAEGAIAFTPQPGTDGPTAGGKIVNGEFQIDAEKGTMEGTFRVRVTASRKTGKKVFDPMAEMGGDTSGDGMIDEIEQYIPARYNRQSELTADVVAGGENRFEFALTSD